MGIQCDGAIWQSDDFSKCFQTRFLQTIFPLIAGVLSVIFLITTEVTRRTKRNRIELPGAEQIAPLEGADEDSDIEDDEDSIADLYLQRNRVATYDTIVAYNKPAGGVAHVVVELIAVLGQVAISVVSLLQLNSFKHNARFTALFASFLVWDYLSILVVLRLYRFTARSRSSLRRLWNHTATLYWILWLCQAPVFRSALIESGKQSIRNVETARFALTTVLAVSALISRRGDNEVRIEYEGDVEPSKEPLASVLSELTFGWVDSIVVKGFKKPLDLEDVWNVAPTDKAEYVLAQFRQIKKSHRLAFQLFWHFKRSLLIQGIWCMIASVFAFVPTLLLKAILSHLEDSEMSPTNGTWLYVILLLVAGLVQGISDGQAFWIGRKVCIQMRGVIIGEIYSKVLRRKVAASGESKLGEVKPVAVTFWQKLMFWKKLELSNTVINSTPLDTQVNNGTVINLMSIDSFKVSDLCSYLHFLWASVPVQLTMAISLLYSVLGMSCFAGVILMVLILPLNWSIAKAFSKTQKQIMSTTDSRLHTTNEVLQNIRIIKYFAWEQRFASKVDEKRQTELKAVWRKFLLWATAATIWAGVPIIITFVSFMTFTLIEKKSLTPSIAFPALSMFSLLRVPLDQLADMITRVQESKVSIDRVEEFLKDEETEKYTQMKMSQEQSPGETKIALQHATLTWGSKTEVVSKGTDAPFRLIDMDVEFVIGELNVIAGPTGSGKTSLLMALLGEMKLLAGSVSIPGGSSRQDLRPDPYTGLIESVAYCAQQAWLVNDTIKENILFNSTYDRQRYNAVIKACALSRDLQILDAGDQTLVGEKGITLSGGQKQRISLARALYSKAKHVLLDDCLSAVDSHTAKHIFEEALTGELMIDRTCILVSHNLALTVPSATFVVVLENGRIKAKGDPVTVIESGGLGEEMKSRPASRFPSRIGSRAVSRAHSRAPSRAVSRAPSFHGSDLEEHLARLLPGRRESDSTSQSDGDSKKKLVDTRIESKAVGSIKMSTIKAFVHAMGPWYFWVCAALGFIAVQLTSVGTNLWIRQWANAYAAEGATGHRHHSQADHSQMLQYDMASGDNSAAQDVNVVYYLSVYAAIGFLFIALCFGRDMLLFMGSWRASWTFHDRLLNRILRAKFRFFDSTPLGQLTNRFSKDVQMIDQEVVYVVIGLLHSAVATVTIIILIATIIPAFLIPAFFIGLIYAATGFFYIRSSRDLKRIESVQNSPLFQHFGETLAGMVTIRAYGDEARFISESHRRVNTANRPFIYRWATIRWLAFRIDASGTLISFFAAMFVVRNAGKIDAGAAGLVLTYAITFTQNVLWLVRLYASNEQNMNSVERVQEYVDVEQEAPASIPETQPDANWPSQGTIEFVGYETRYRQDLQPVLRDLTFKIQAGEKVGIVGRTGAGKSSLALALFRGLEADQGKVIIDDVDVGLIGLQDLREAITIVPQDPTLFSGTLRSNLDPFEMFTDEEVYTALRRVHLISSTYGFSEGSQSLTQSPRSDVSTLVDASAENGLSETPSNFKKPHTVLVKADDAQDNKNIFQNLSYPITESGSNLSQGQRQLLCLARALLKSPRVLVMDEATASIDYITDAKIQETLRELKSSTIITIAHRLQTIIDYDKVLVLDKGEIIEYADPWELLQKPEGVFKSMCEDSGDMEVLMPLAEKAWGERQLINDS